MIYSPKDDGDMELLNLTIKDLGESDGAISAGFLKDRGRYVIPFLLNAWENPPQNVSHWFDIDRFYKNLDRLLRELIARDDLTLEQLQRYRRLITSEKMEK